MFISYRREDTGPAAGRVYDRLAQLLTRANVFFDVSSIDAGEDFAKRINAEMDLSETALVFIGSKWTEPLSQTGKSRLWESNDYVRVEVGAALHRDIRVLPVLVSGALMPKPEDLPEDIRAITTRNAVPLRHETFDDDTENIVAAVLGTSYRNRPWERRGTAWSKIGYAATGGLASVILLVLLAQVHSWIFARPVAASIGEPLTLILIIASPIVGVWLGLKSQARKRR